VAHPIPGFRVTTPYGTRGGWSCDRDAAGLGLHTGDDYSTQGKLGFAVHATAAGEVVIVSQGAGGWGSDFGRHVVIESGGVRHGYCHLNRIFVSVGSRVAAGERIAESGNTGRVKGTIGPHLGAHLHYEERVSPFTFCAGRRKPQLNRGPGPSTTIPVGQVRVSKLRFGVNDSDSVRRLQDVLNGISLSGGQQLRVSGDYNADTKDEVRRWQTQVIHETPQFADGNLGPLQAKRMFARTGNTVINDT
jgi:hypothetical protein